MCGTKYSSLQSSNSLGLNYRRTITHSASESVLCRPILYYCTTKRC